MMKSLWQQDRPILETDQFQPDATYDAVVVGAGLTGLSAALLLARAGLRVTVLEARSIGAAASGRTTAKLSLLQGTVLSGMRQHFSREVVDAYVQGNREGRAWLLRYLDEHSVAVQRRDAYTYAEDASGRSKLEREAEAARDAGLDVVEHEGDLGLPFPVAAGLGLADQAQFNPMDVLEAMAMDLRSRGGRIVQGARVRGIDTGVLATVRTDQGSNRAQHAILATGIPILDRGLYFAKLEPSRSYVAAYRMAGDSGSLPRGMYLSVDEPSRSLRTAAFGQEELLLVGGNSHPVGQADSELAMLEDLQQWTQGRFAGAEPVLQWSAQDYKSANMVPFAGLLPRGGGNIHVATGYNKWGMSNAVASALRISANILGGNLPWSDVLSQRISSPTSLLEGTRINAKVAGNLAKGWASSLINAESTSKPGETRASASGPAAEHGEAPAGEVGEGEGVMLRDGVRPVAVSKTEGKLCAVSRVCTHLGGVLSWNDAEKSWDCPLHGSRFSPSGEILEGPATKDLPAAETANGD